MDDNHPFLEKQIGHKPYGKVPRFGRIAISLLLYLAVWANLIRERAKAINSMPKSARCL
jgi:hypothetical protein